VLQFSSIETDRAQLKFGVRASIPANVVASRARQHCGMLRLTISLPHEVIIRRPDMGRDAVLEARADRVEPDNDDYVISFSRSMPLPWLMLFDRACLTLVPDNAPELASDRDGAVARFRTRAIWIAPRLAFVPEADRLLARFADYLAAVERPWLSVFTWEQWISDVDEGLDFNGSLVRALDALAQGPDLDDTAWQTLLDWSQPSRHNADYWHANHRIALFGWPGNEGPDRPWTV
jgi:hypothetical protein